MSEFPNQTSNVVILDWIASERRKLPKARRSKAPYPVENILMRTNVYDFPLHAFDQTLKLLDHSVIEPVMSRESSLGSLSSGLTCLTCKLVFLEWKEQHEHFKTDLHRFNIRSKLRGLPPLTAEEFADQHGHGKSKSRQALSSRNSTGNDSDAFDRSFESSEASGASDSDNDTNIKAQTHTVVDEESYLGESFEEERDESRYIYEDDHGIIRKLFSNTNGPSFLIQPKHTHPWQFTLSLAVFTQNSPFSKRDWVYEKHLWANLKEDVKFIQSKPMTAVIALRSGRFAGAIYDQSNTGNPLVVHKVLRRYTVRAKAGGGQSSHDNKSGKARSMGAQLRRYGEQALQEDVQKLLTIWQDYLAHCGVILIATTKSMRTILFDLPTTANTNHLVLLNRDDPRIVFVPFAVDRPTLEATSIIRAKALQVIVADHVPPSATFALDTNDDNDSVISGSTLNSTQGRLKGLEKLKLETIKSDSIAEESLDKDLTEEQMKAATERAMMEEQLLSNPLSRSIIEAIASGDDKAAVTVIRQVATTFNPLPRTSNAVDMVILVDESKEEGDEQEREDDDDGPVILRQFSQDLVDILQLPQDIDALFSPLHLAAANDMHRTVMTLLRLGANPEQLDARGRTPFFLATSKEMRDTFRRARGELGEERWKWPKTGIPEPITDKTLAMQKQKEKEKKKRAQQRKKEQKLKSEQEAADAKLAYQLQEEMKQQQLREQEERFKALAGNCAVCNKGLFKQEVIDVLDKKCCSSGCVVKLRRQLAAEAAAARFGGGGSK